jgi:hypothetical protein
MLKVVQPIFTTILRWIYEGELEDTYQEVSNLCTAVATEVLTLVSPAFSITRSLRRCSSVVAVRVPCCHILQYGLLYITILSLLNFSLQNIVDINSSVTVCCHMTYVLKIGSSPVYPLDQCTFCSQNEIFRFCHQLMAIC